MRQRPSLDRRGQRFSGSLIARRRLPVTAPGVPATSPWALIADFTSASSTAVGYGSRPVTPNWQHSVVPSHENGASSASTSA